MKKIEYIAPEMEVIKLSAQRAVLQAVSGDGGGSTPGGGIISGGDGPIEE
jgi:hypothetical protein